MPPLRVSERRSNRGAQEGCRGTAWEKGMQAKRAARPGAQTVLTRPCEKVRTRKTQAAALLPLRVSERRSDRCAQEG
ncbi:hypothetical protein NDU88_002347 [Pleurodeles waltl]|uniref:Uncharacterized protein n=1 Tax=Pleurodeles waltl TaxID=8319 RepID=A0AAV7SC92_PLEWA|nr:hypothetical protein NDU88_002347 [Pleurodeles waltl]